MTQKRMGQMPIFLRGIIVCAPWPKEVIETIQNTKNAFIVKGNEEHYLHCPKGDDILGGCTDEIVGENGLVQ